MIDRGIITGGDNEFQIIGIGEGDKKDISILVLLDSIKNGDWQFSQRIILLVLIAKRSVDI